MRRFISLIFILISFASSYAHAEINHLELGAANYSLDEGNSPLRYSVLISTVEKLIEEHGPTGTIYLNDIFLDGLKMAQDVLQSWMQERGLKIDVVLLHGDYNRIALPQVKTAHLANPGEDQLALGYQLLALDRYIAANLERIASYSETGLKITSYYNVSLMHQFIDIESRLSASNEAAPEYYWPNGRTSGEIDSDFLGRKPKTYILKVDVPTPVNPMDRAAFTAYHCMKAMLGSGR